MVELASSFTTHTHKRRSVERLKVVCYFPQVLKEFLKTIENSPSIIDQHPPEKLTTGAYYYICVVLTVIFFSFIGTSITAYEYFNKLSKDKNYSFSRKQNANDLKKTEMERKVQEDSTGKDITFKSIFKCFCIYSNGKKLFTTSTTANPLNCLHGLRFFATLVVITTHFIGTIFLLISDYRSIEAIASAWYAQFLWNGIVIILEFFMIGGFLNAYLFCSEYGKKNGKISYSLYYIQRLIRTTPVFMAVYWFYTLLFSYTGSGPLWPSFATNPLCLQRWWTYPLYVNNMESMTKTCLPVLWYLAADMQLYMISPMFMIALIRWPKLGYTLIGAAICVSSLFSSITTYQYNLVLGFSRLPEHLSNLEPFLERFWEFGTVLYSKTTAQLTPYVIGIFLGHYWYKRENDKSGKVSKMTRCCGWILTCFLMWFYFFGLYGTKVDPWANAIFVGIKDVSFSFGFAWILFMCLSGHTGSLSKFLSLKGFQVFSRLGLSVYLTHPIVMMHIFYSVRKYIESPMTLLVLLSYTIAISYVSAIVVCLLFEAPIVRLLSLYKQHKLASRKKAD
ncbi:nose resistant to fluoxetine protein 6 [Trichonephila inaurata madagascariensis]|uniref:Nose resistant to fluoxetine protein 6 n=1 Tax=Trichonephila inaurata madagascariensis TaxID=2747483 RepID=A0A8X6Y618_9ARAC|nr:nose resistant to fluoxetine protein 6 [Trichonephila inaurata madagascariensis]